ncbi:MAG: YdbH domain-containing protein [Pseudomonadota bacterium]
MKRLLPVTIVLLSLLVLSGTAIWVLRDTVARSVADRVLHGTGLRITEVTDIQPSLAGTTVGELAVELTGSGRIQRFSDIEVTYNVTGLRSGQVQDIRVGRADLDLVGGSAASEPAADAPRLTDIAGMIRQAPLQSVQIEDLRFNHLHTNERTLALTLRWQGNRMTGQLGDGETDVQLDLDWQIEEADTAQSPLSSAVPMEAGFRAQTGSLPALEIALTVVPRNGMLHVQASSDVDSGTTQPVIDAVARRLSLSPMEASPLSFSAGIAVEAKVPDALELPRTLQLTANIGAGGNVVLPASLLPDSGVGVVEGHWEEPVTLTVDIRGAGEEPEWTLTGDHLAMTVPDMDTGAAQVVNATLTLDGYRLHCLSLATCDFSAGSALQAESVALALSDNEPPEWIQLREPSLTIPTLEGALADNTLTLQAPAETRLSLPEAGLGTLSARNTEATLHTAASLEFPLADIDALRLQAGELSVDLPLLRSGDQMAGLALRARDLDTRPLGAFMLDTEIRLSNAYTNLFAVNLWDAALTATISAESDRVDFDADVTLNDLTAATVSGSHDLATSTGRGRLEVPDITFDDAGNSLSDFIDPLPVSLDLVSGTFAGHTELEWRLPEEAVPVVTGIVDFGLTDIAGFYDSIGFIDLDTRLHARLDEDLQLQSEAEESFRIGRLDVGFPIEDIGATYRFDSEGPAIEVSEAEMTLFGGRITADRLSHDAGAEANTNTLMVERLDIARVLSLSAYEGITATGIVSGAIPLTIRGTRLTVSDGRLAALPPGGTISYRGGSTDSGNDNLDLVYSALRNYRYSLLEADVDYMADGELLLAVRMEGVAPAIDDQRINLNVNIQDNIPSLLESLQAGRDIAESIQRQQGGGE